MMYFIQIFLFSFFLVAGVHAETDHAHGRLLTAYEGVGTFKEIEMGLELSMDDQWYTYWRVPGDAGLAPVMDWSKSQNVSDVKVSWPAPKRFVAFDMHSFGYDGTVILPLSVIPEKTEEGVVLDLKLDIVVCHEICIPQTLHLQKTVMKGNPVRTEDRSAISAARATLPAYENTRDISMETAVLGKEAITVVASSKKGFSDQTDMFIEAGDLVLTSVPEITTQDSGRKAVIKIKAPEGADLMKLLGKRVIITLRNDDQALEKEFSF